MRGTSSKATLFTTHTYGSRLGRVYDGGTIVSVVLSEAEYQLLEKLRGRVERGREYSVDELVAVTGLPRSSLEALLSLLEQKGIVEVRRVKTRKLALTELAEKYLREGLPEEKLAKLLEKRGGRVSVDEVSRELGDEAGVAVANALKLNMVRRDNGYLVLVKPPPSPDRLLLEKVREGGELGDEDVKRLRRRRLVKVVEESRTVVVFKHRPEEVLETAQVEVGALTHEHLRSGAWRRLRLRRYNVAAEPPRLYANRLHFLVEFLEMLRDVMVEMGFREVEYPAIELEFWNYDALFQPQFHPARSPTDTFYVSAPAQLYEVPEKELTEKVKRVHERAWRYVWRLDRALRLILRSHTTAVSARVLSARPRPPFRFFTIGRVYRVEKVDPKHLPEFHQLDGIAAEDNMTFRDLLGILAEFFERIGIAEYRFRLAYFPFTEPSAEAYVRVRGEWMEVLGCGLFRPEVLEPFGIDYPVAAWGMGIERLAMSLYGVADIRELYTFDANRLKEFPEVWTVYARSKV